MVCLIFVVINSIVIKRNNKFDSSLILQLYRDIIKWNIRRIGFNVELSFRFLKIFCTLRICIAIFAHTSMRTSAVSTMVILLQVTLKSFQIIGENL